ncbi:MAG: hypothetical protein AB7P40_28340 [Chloroflexota bacterium]
MRVCEGTISEREEIKTVEQEDGTVSHEAVTIPARACEREAVILSRSMEEQICNLDGRHWMVTEDHYFCRMCVVPGQMRFLDGRITEHPPMAAEDGAA